MRKFVNPSMVYIVRADLVAGDVGRTDHAPLRCRGAQRALEGLLCVVTNQSDLASRTPNYNKR
jgi:hypothetical protein